MSAEIPQKLKVRVTFETEFEWDAPTEADAIKEFNAAVADGTIESDVLDLNTDRVRIEAVSEWPNHPAESGTA